MIPPTFPIRFSSTIRIVPEDEFNHFDIEKMKAQGLTSESPWSLKDIVSLESKAATTGAAICNAGGIQNGKRITLFHLCPYDSLWDKSQSNADYETWEKIAKKLEADVAELKKENPNVRGFLTGGKPGDEHSERLGGNILAFFQKLGIPVTFLWGSRGWEDVHYDAPSDTWTLHTSPAALSAEALQQRFSTIHIDEGDRLFIGDKEIDPGEVNT